MKIIKFIKSNYVTLALIALGATFIVIGTYREEISIVFSKSIRICLECIGIG